MSKHSKTTDERQDYAAELYASSFYNALGHGMSETEADAFATRRVYASRHTLQRWGRS